MEGPNGEDISPQQVVDMTPGDAGIRLISCSVGACDNGFAAQLAWISGRDVLAPTDLLDVYENGELHPSQQLLGVTR